jgi:D-aminopeptidase
MKVFISVDMEGVTGVTDPEDVLPDGADYARGRVFMTGDANAAIVGAYDGGATGCWSTTRTGRCAICCSSSSIRGRA